MAYLTPLEWRTRTAMPSGDCASLETDEPGYVAARIELHGSKIDARLAKRYATPFATPVPPIVLGWVEALVTYDAYKKRGFNPSAMQDQTILDDAKTALEEIKEAADAKDGLFDLPLRADLPGQSGIDRGGPICYSESSPYEWTDRQREAIRRHH
jgi:hypothetical protein